MAEDVAPQRRRLDGFGDFGGLRFGLRFFFYRAASVCVFVLSFFFLLAEKRRGHPKGIPFRSGNQRSKVYFFFGLEKDRRHPRFGFFFSVRGQKRRHCFGFLNISRQVFKLWVEDMVVVGKQFLHVCFSWFCG